MTNFRRFANVAWLLCLCLLLLFLSNSANAQDKYWGGGITGKTIVFGKDAAAVCSSGLAIAQANGYVINPATVWVGAMPTSSTGRFNCEAKYISDGRAVILGSATQRTCTTSAPYFDPISKICVKSETPPVDRCDVPAGSKITWYQKTGTGSMDSEHSDVAGFPKSSPTCYLTGMADVNSCYRYEIPGPKYQYACKFEGTSNGEPVAWGQGPELAEPPTSGQPPVTTPPFQSPDDKSCPRGTVNAGLSASGIPMCIGQGTDPKNTPAAPPKVEVEKNEVLPDGSTEHTKSVTTKNADGSTTTVKTVTVTKSTGEKETTQEKNTTQTPTGKPGKETENPVTESPNVCKQNPNLAMCKNSTVGGKCGETSCTGDAIQCATLRAAAILQCKAEKDELDLKASPLAAKGQSAMDGGDMEGLPGPKNGLVVNVNSMKTEGWLGNGAAFDDITVSIRGQQVVVPLSKWSQYLLPFRYMLMIIAGLISFRILAGAVLKE